MSVAEGSSARDTLMSQFGNRARYLITVAVTGLVAGAVIGAIAFKVSDYQPILPADVHPSLREQAVDRMLGRFMAVAIVACWILIGSFGRVQLGRRLKGIAYGTLAGVALVTIPAAALLPQQHKGESDYKESARNSLPYAALAGAIAGFVYSFWIPHSVKNESQNPPPSDSQP